MLFFRPIVFKQFVTSPLLRGFFLTVLQAVVVRVDDAADAEAVWLAGVAVQRKAVAHAAVHHPAESQSQKSAI